MPIKVIVRDNKNNCKNITLGNKPRPLKTDVTYSHNTTRLFKNNTHNRKIMNVSNIIEQQQNVKKSECTFTQLTEQINNNNAQPIVNTEINAQPIVNTKTNNELSEQLNKTPKYTMIMNTIDDAINTHIINGCAVRGTAHIKNNTIGQDYCDYKTIGKGWGIAVVADGAGSYPLSHKGSKSNCIQAIRILESIIKNKNWMENNYMPTEMEWYIIAINTFNKIYQFATHYANNKNIKVSELSATIIVNIITPKGLLTAHIGDGRCGYLNNKGEWKATMTPHKGEEANQTVFLHTNLHKIAGAELNNVLIPETKVIIDDIQAFTLMSDGCEKSTWECSTITNEMWTDPNKPHSTFFNNIINILKNDEEPIKALTTIVKTSKIFNKETDDKTIIIGYKI